jgi:hypothetical protein
VLDASYEMTGYQVSHASKVLALVPALAALRHRLCPKTLSEKHFWRVYFLLLRNIQRKHAAIEAEAAAAAAAAAVESGADAKGTVLTTATAAATPSGPASTNTVAATAVPTTAATAPTSVDSDVSTAPNTSTATAAATADSLALADSPSPDDAAVFPKVTRPAPLDTATPPVSAPSSVSSSSAHAREVSTDFDFSEIDGVSGVSNSRHYATAAVIAPALPAAPISIISAAPSPVSVTTDPLLAAALQEASELTTHSHNISTDS